jgi:hypothetical protein
MNELKTFRDHLDAVAGAQIAQSIILNVLMQNLRRDERVIEFVQGEAERMKAELLGSHASDSKIRNFDEVIQAYLEALAS